MLSQPVKESLKEALRLAAFAALSALITYFSGLEAAWAVYLTFVLRAVDKYVHANPSIKFNGLLPW